MPHDTWRSDSSEFILRIKGLQASTPLVLIRSNTLVIGSWVKDFEHTNYDTMMQNENSDIQCNMIFVSMEVERTMQYKRSMLFLRYSIISVIAFVSGIMASPSREGSGNGNKVRLLTIIKEISVRC